MHVKSLKVFCDVVGRRSFSQAAAENGISQSNASQIVQHLEESLGVRLIDRSKRPFVLTAEGEVYYDGCRKLVQHYSTLEEEVRTLHQEVEGRVNVASIYSVGLIYGKQLLATFTRRYPRACVHVEYEHPDRVYALVAEDQVDVGLVSYAQSTRTIKAVAWREEPILLVSSPDHPLLARESIRLEDLNNLAMIGFDRNLPIRRRMDRELAERGVEPQIVMAFDNIDTIKQAIAVNGGVSLLPEPAVCQELKSGQLRAIRVENLQMVRPLGIIYRRGVELGKTARRFIQLLQQTSGPPCMIEAGGGAPDEIHDRSEENEFEDERATDVGISGKTRPV